MDKITIICAVAVEFTPPAGEKKYCITRKDIGLVLQAPSWIQNTLTFKWLVNDGSLKYVNSSNRVQMENDPLFGMTAEGKAYKPETEAAKEKAPESEKAPVQKSTRKKKDDAE